MKKNNFLKGEVATILTIGALVIIGISSLVSSLFLKNKQPTSIKSKAQEGGPGHCRDNPFPPPTVDSSKGFYYIWKADCDGSLGFVKQETGYFPACQVKSDKPNPHEDCIQNTSDPRVNPETSSWCYGFEGNYGDWRDFRCLQLQVIEGAPAPTNPDTSNSIPGGDNTTPISTTSQSQSGNTLTPTPTPECAREGEYSFDDRPCCPGFVAEGSVITIGGSLRAVECVNNSSSRGQTSTSGGSTPTPTRTPTRTPTPTPTLSPSPAITSNNIINVSVSFANINPSYIPFILKVWPNNFSTPPYLMPVNIWSRSDLEKTYNFSFDKIAACSEQNECIINWAIIKRDQQNESELISGMVRITDSSQDRVNIIIDLIND